VYSYSINLSAMLPKWWTRCAF